MTRTLRPVWKWLDRYGLEAATITMDGEGVQMCGLAVTELDARPLRLGYRLHLTSAWSFRAGELEVESADGRRLLAISHTQAGWAVDGLPRADLAGCEDIDIMGSPLTNTLPIRRLEWAPGQSRELSMAYIRLPDLAVLPVRQGYTRLDGKDAPSAPGERRFEYTLVARAQHPPAPQRRFAYHSVETGFRAELRVDEDGLVLDYPPYWRQFR